MLFAFAGVSQEAFFGKELLDKSKQSKQALETGPVEEEAGHGDGKPPSANSSFLDPSSDPLLSVATTPISGKAGGLRMFIHTLSHTWANIHPSISLSTVLFF